MAQKRSKCSSGCGRDARYPGPFCAPCWRKAGKPTAEQISQRRFEATYEEVARAVAADNPAPASEVQPDAPVLSTESEGELSAMQWVTTHAPGDERTWEQRSARQFKESAPAAFYKRKADLEAVEHPAVGPPLAWDGVDRRAKEKPLDDPGTSRILALLAELDEREKEPAI